MHGFRLSSCLQNVAALIGLTLTLGTLGCNKPLFPEDMPRSQYERYSQLRGRQRQAPDDERYGGDRSDLRERLKPLGEP